MFTDHPEFKKPDDPETKIWRYMDFRKFVDILDTKSLFFSRSDTFDDHFESSYPQLSVTERPQDFVEQGVPEETAQLVSDLSKTFRRFVALNCWHMNSYESAAMWRLYLKSNEGMAIQSTYGQLVKSFHQSEDQIHVGVVSYIDYDSDRIPGLNVLRPFLYKRKSFAHENEIRTLIVRHPAFAEGPVY